MSLSAVFAAAALGGALGTVAPAHAYTCSASALRGTVLTSSGLEPVVAGGDGACRSDAASLDKLPAPLAGIAGASTDLAGPAAQPAQQQARATAGVEGFSIGSLRSVPVALPAAQIPSGLDAVRVPLPANPALLGLPSAITVDALPAAKALIPDRQLPDTALAAVDSLRSFVSGQCLAGLPNLDGASIVQGLRALGDQLPVGQPVDRAVTLLAEQSIPLDGIDVAKVALPAGLSFADPVTGAALRSAVSQALSGLPPIVLPAAVGHVTTTPAEQRSENGVLEQRALHMTVSMLGKQVADLVMGIAKIATDGLSCAEAAVAPVVKSPEPSPPPVQPASQLAVSCAKAAITLVNVIDKENHVSLIGAAERKLVGKRVRIVSAWNGKTVARTRVGRSGFFRAHAPLPKNRIRWSNTARYEAVAGGKHSSPLKLHRRMRFSTLKHRGNHVVLTGRVFGPQTNRSIEIRRRVSC